MCNRARFRSEPETLFERFGANWAADVVRPNRDPQELFSKAKAYVVRHERDEPVVDVMSWDVLGGGAKWPMTNVRNLKATAMAHARCRPGEPLSGTPDRILRMDARHVPDRQRQAGKGGDVV